MPTDGQGLTICATKPLGMVASLLAEQGLTILPAADEEGGDEDRYLLSPRVAVERRTGSSFRSGIVDKTLFTSAIALRDHFPIAILVVEGEMGDDYSNLHPRAVRGALTAMLLQYGLSVLSTNDPEETAALLAMIARQEQVGIPEISLIPKRKAVDLPDRQRRVVEMLPGCGLVLARRLLQHFGSVRRVIGATKEELRAFPGIGPKRAAEILEVIDADYAALDTERDLEDAIAAEPGLLFEEPAVLVARQHTLFTEARERHVVDMVFLDPGTDALILVELKHGPLQTAHCDQLRRYLDHAARSAVLQAFLAKGTRLRGILATATECCFDPGDGDIAVRFVDRARAIETLRALRRRLQAAGDAAAP
ncbi:MAG: hypothetical protein HY321_04310 [Armatimonadetes bacterium]|nr:hypothetical protein [Armatimonadota bacterium]